MVLGFFLFGCFVFFFFLDFSWVMKHRASHPAQGVGRRWFCAQQKSCSCRGRHHS